RAGRVLRGDVRPPQDASHGDGSGARALDLPRRRGGARVLPRASGDRVRARTPAGTAPALRELVPRRPQAPVPRPRRSPLEGGRGPGEPPPPPGTRGGRRLGALPGPYGGMKAATGRTSA